MSTPADRMDGWCEPPTVLVTGAGGPAGVNVLVALRRAGHRTVAADIDPTAAGLHLADAAGVLPGVGDPTCVDELCALAARTGATVLVPTVAEELVAFAAAEGTLRAAGLATWLPDPGAVGRCTDKWAFAETIATLDVAAPATGLGTAEGVPGPWIVKPRFGRGSRDVIPADDDDDLRWALRRVPDPIVQTRLPGCEFSVDALLDRDGTLAGAVPRWRSQTRGGISTKGTTFVHDRLVRDTATLLAGLGVHGPANVQGFVASDGTPWFIEVNPRFSGGLALSQAAGADLVGEYVRGALGLPVRPERLAYRAGVSMTRYFAEIVLERVA